MFADARARRRVSARPRPAVARDSNARRALVKRFALPPRPDGSSFWSDKKVAVIGGGPSGLATALALRAKGIDGVRVFERTEAIKPNVGGGFNLNGGARVLCELGLEATYDALANDLLGVKARRAKEDSDCLR